MVNEPTASIALVWIPLLPLVGAGVHALLLVTARRLLSRNAVTTLSSLMVLGSLVVSIYALVELIGLPEGSQRLLDHRFSWMGLGVGDELLSIDLAFQLDALSGSFALMITAIGLAIHVYAVGFMRTDRRTDAGYQRFFCYLNLMLGAMLVLVLAENLPLMFLGWAAVGLCVAALMAFWYSDDVSARAGNRAFAVSYIADVALLGAMAWIFWTLAGAGLTTLGVEGIPAGANAILQETKTLPGGFEVGLASLMGLGIWLAVCARSAQFPLHFWYPDSARAPAPAVALVTLSMCVGVYLCCRFSFLFAEAPLASNVIAWTGALTALGAGVMALVQLDVNRILTYTAMSHVGLIFVGIGSGAFGAAIYHQLGFAFFQTLLFLVAGSVIHSLDGERDIRRMGGLRLRLPLTHVVAVIAVFSPAAFLSKEELLVSAFTSYDIPANGWLYAASLLAVGAGALALFRLLVLGFWGTSRTPFGYRGRLSDPSRFIMGPLIALAFFSVFVGLFNPSQFWGDMVGVENSDSLSNFVRGVVVIRPTPELDPVTRWQLLGAATLSSLLAFGIAWLLYVRIQRVPPKLQTSLEPLTRGLLPSLRRSGLVDRYLAKPLVTLSRKGLLRGVERGILDRFFARGVSMSVRGLATHALRYVQSGLAQFYFISMLAGVVLMIVYFTR